jgi:hypothetical protein
MDFGSSNSYTTPQPTAEQTADIKARTGLLTDTIIPAYKETVRGATDIYNTNAGGVLNAAQNQAGVARQAQQTLGEVGESGLRSGTSTLQSLFNPDYERNQIQAALAPAQAQYQQNLAGQQAQFGGAGNLGSARQALAGQQLAGANQAQMASTAAQVQRDVAAQRSNNAQFLAGQGSGQIGQALGAAGQQTTASQIPMDFYSKLASIYYGAPASSYTPDYRGTIGTQQGGTSFGVKGINPFAGM